jgi:hypothetical protein
MRFIDQPNATLIRVHSRISRANSENADRQPPPSTSNPFCPNAPPQQNYTASRKPQAHLRELRPLRDMRPLVSPNPKSKIANPKLSSRQKRTKAFK